MRWSGWRTRIERAIRIRVARNIYWLLVACEGDDDGGRS